jgi:sugar phosphate permease
MSGGSLAAAFVQGKVVDWAFAREAQKLNLPVTKSKQQDLSNFPIERARLKVAFPMILLATLSTITYGWLLHYRVSIAGPCIVLFVMGFSMIGATQTVSILIVDINPGQAGTATAAFNLVRCLLGAAATAVILPMTERMGLGWSYVLVGLVWIVMAPMLWAVVRWGPQWRRERRERAERIERERQERDNVVLV